MQREKQRERASGSSVFSEKSVSFSSSFRIRRRVEWERMKAAS